MRKKTLIAFSMLTAFAASATPLLAADSSESHELVGIDWPTVIWILMIFILLVAVLYKTAWKNVLAGLKAREDRIRKDIAEAEAARVKADEALKQYNARLVEADQKIQVLLGQAATDAEKIATSIKMRAQHDAEETKERATKEIEAAKQAAIAEIYQQTAELATTIAEKIIRRSLNADDQRDLVNQSLDQLQSVHTN
jgi:F-type H+-transporting ATPase subunit b